MHCIGFEPFYTADSTLLVLGSFPSVKSRAEGFYYGNPQNRFWRVLAAAFDAPVPQTIPQKKQLLTLHGIALWDVVTECDIVGSMDKDIRNPVLADIPALLARCPIRKIVTNGGTAHRLLRRAYADAGVPVTALPSTSPANARFNSAAWINEWKKQG